MNQHNLGPGEKSLRSTYRPVKYNSRSPPGLPIARRGAQKGNTSPRPPQTAPAWKGAQG